uniref:Uncharacterized protein n=1 Tax=Phaeomonas parva TaxID=124430 RepID=A0A7S1UD53_9STRA|mmetsp:Transcript_41827/g.131055  ORF Transcript_41827/g.131055 Transcript_41827/m.131055 type:complete len:826 (+) Transcript_41827:303-2780(+)
MASVTTMAALASKFGHASPQDRELYRSRLRWMVTTSAAFAWGDVASPADADMLRAEAYAAKVLAAALKLLADVNPLRIMSIPAPAELPPATKGPLAARRIIYGAYSAAGQFKKVGNAFERTRRVIHYGPGDILIPLVNFNTKGAGMKAWLKRIQDITEAFIGDWERIVVSTKHLTDAEKAVTMHIITALKDNDALEYEIFIKLSIQLVELWAFAYSCTNITPAKGCGANMLEAATGIPGLCGHLEHLEQERRRSAHDIVEVLRAYKAAGESAPVTHEDAARSLRECRLQDVVMPMEEGLEYPQPRDWVEQFETKVDTGDERAFNIFSLTSWMPQWEVDVLLANQELEDDAKKVIVPNVTQLVTEGIAPDSVRVDQIAKGKPRVIVDGKPSKSSYDGEYDKETLAAAEAGVHRVINCLGDFCRRGGSGGRIVVMVDPYKSSAFEKLVEHDDFKDAPSYQADRGELAVFASKRAGGCLVVVHPPFCRVLALRTDERWQAAPPGLAEHRTAITRGRTATILARGLRLDAEPDNDIQFELVAAARLILQHRFHVSAFKTVLLGKFLIAGTAAFHGSNLKRSRLTLDRNGKDKATGEGDPSAITHRAWTLTANNLVINGDVDGLNGLVAGQKQHATAGTHSRRKKRVREKATAANLNVEAAPALKRSQKRRCDAMVPRGVDPWSPYPLASVLFNKNPAKGNALLQGALDGGLPLLDAPTTWVMQFLDGGTATIRRLSQRLHVNALVQFLQMKPDRGNGIWTLAHINKSLEGLAPANKPDWWPESNAIFAADPYDVNAFYLIAEADKKDNKKAVSLTRREWKKNTGRALPE